MSWSSSNRLGWGERERGTLFDGVNREPEAAVAKWLRDMLMNRIARAAQTGRMPEVPCTGRPVGEGDPAGASGKRQVERRSGGGESCDDIGRHLGILSPCSQSGRLRP